MSPGAFFKDNEIQISTGSKEAPLLRAYLETSESSQVLYEFARRCLEEKIVKIDVTDLEDGGVLLGPPKIIKPKKFFGLLMK